MTRDWWAAATKQFRMLISQVVLDECSAGDPIAARERLEVIDSIDLLEIDDAVRALANELIVSGAIPSTEPRDALHVAVAAVNGVEYLVTWNFKHIANAAMRTQIETACRRTGFELPIICTPEELAGNDSHA